MIEIFFFITMMQFTFLTFYPKRLNTFKNHFHKQKGRNSVATLELGIAFNRKN